MARIEFFRKPLASLLSTLRVMSLQQKSAELKANRVFFRCRKLSSPPHSAEFPRPGKVPRLSQISARRKGQVIHAPRVLANRLMRLKRRVYKRFVSSCPEEKVQK